MRQVKIYVPCNASEIYSRYFILDNNKIIYFYWNVQDVASRGLDLPLVDRIIQFNAPITPTDYVHRVGRTARVGQKGEATLFLTPHEAMFIANLQDHSIV